MGWSDGEFSLRGTNNNDGTFRVLKVEQCIRTGINKSNQSAIDSNADPHQLSSAVTAGVTDSIVCVTITLGSDGGGVSKDEVVTSQGKRRAKMQQAEKQKQHR